ncbi:MAG TPA: hypothetical protein EYN69_00505 [Flavobacteriales bacterium]|nr:hypothetical protein [Flavobacteriales bacterium]
MNTNKENSDEIRKELEGIAPRLSKIEKVNPFEVPDGYFDNLPRLVSDRINEASTAHRAAVRTLTFRWTAVAASITLIAAFAYIFNNTAHLDDNMDLAQLDIEEIADALVDEGAFTVEEEDLIELLIMVEEGKQSATEEKESDTNEIIEYLIDSDIDLTTIIDELES